MPMLAAVAWPPSPDTPDVPVPANVSMPPVASVTTRTRRFASSAM